MTTDIKPITAADLMDAAIHGKPIDPLRALAAYADPSNWVQCYGGEDSDGNKLKPCEWAFIGPTRPGYELAQHTLSRLNDKDQERRTMDTDNTQDGAEPSPASVGYRCGIATRESDLVGRLPLAAVLRLIAPGYSTCKRCKMPWAFTQGHCTKWNESNGMFPLCEHCWQRLSPSERLPYYRMLWQEWHEWGPVRDPAWHDVEAAVMAGL